MAFEVKHRLEGGLLRVDIGGTLDPTRTLELVGQVWQWVQQPGVKALLADIRALQGRSSMSETYFNIRNYPTGAIRMRTAVLELPENMDRGSFHDTAAGNLGYNIRHFENEEAALAWLAEVLDE
jgi:hypothetical protein